jgi:hypothetical protein
MRHLTFPRLCLLLGLLLLPVFLRHSSASQETQALPKAFLDGTGPGWRALGEADFAPVNGYPDTWAWKNDLLTCTGKPIGVMRTKQKFTNFELVVQWRHLRSAGNSGVFVWVPEEALTDLKPGNLPKFGIEVQMLDHGYKEQYEKQSGKKGDWFTTNGDIFAVGNSKLNHFPRFRPTVRAASRAKISAKAWANGIITTCAVSTAKCASGSTAKKFPAATAQNRAAATYAWNQKAHRLNSKTCVCASCRNRHGFVPVRL